MDVPLNANPPPAYGEPLDADQFDAKIRQGIQASAQAPQPQEHWQTWDEATFAANSALNLIPPGSSSSTSSLAPSSQIPPSASVPRSPPLVHNNNNSASPYPQPLTSPVSTTTTTSQQRKQRQLPQIPPVQLARYQSTKRDRKPLLGARSMHQHPQITEAMARKEAEGFYTSTPLWQAQAQILTGSSTTPGVDAPHPPPTTVAPMSSPSAVSAQVTDLASSSLPTVAEVEERHASLFGDNTAWRRTSLEDDEAPPPFAPVAPALGDAHLEEAMAELQRLHLASAPAEPTPQAPVDASDPNSSGTPVPAPENNPITPSQNPSSASRNHPAQAPYTPQSAVSEKMALAASELAAGEEQFNSYNNAGPSSSSPAPQSSTAPAHYRYSAPPAPIRVAPSPTSSPTPGENTWNAPASASATVPTAAMSRAQSTSARATQARSGPSIRFDPNTLYQQNSGPAGGARGNFASNPADFYSASVSSTMKNSDRRPPARHRTSMASFVSPTSYAPPVSFASSNPPSAYNPPGSMYGPASTPSLNQAYYAPAQDNSSVRSGSPPPRSSSPYSMRGGAGLPIGSLGVIDRSGAGNPGAPEPWNVNGGDSGYNAGQHALLYQHALQQPAPGMGIGSNGLQRQQTVQVQDPPRSIPVGGYFPSVPPPPPPPVGQQMYQPQPSYPPQLLPTSSGTPQPPWASAPLRPPQSSNMQPQPQGAYPPYGGPPPPMPQQQQPQMPYAPQYQPQQRPRPHPRVSTLY